VSTAELFDDDETTSDPWMRESVLEFHAEGHEADKIALLLLDGLHIRAAVTRHRLHYPLTQFAREILRYEARKAEQNAFSARARRERPASQVGLVADVRWSSAKLDPEQLASFKDLLPQEFSYARGQKITWGEATIAQHEMRVAMLIKHREGVDDTISRHRLAIEALHDSGKRKLNSLIRH
jgi:hypothetical protein